MSTTTGAFRVLVLGLALLAACATPGAVQRGSGPRTLAEAAAAAPSAQRRASIQIADNATRALDQGDLQAAEVLAERALRVDGRNPYAYLVLGEVTTRTENPQGALRHLEQAEALFATEDPGSRQFRAQGLLAQADLLDRMGDRAKAEQRRDQARSVRGESVW